MNNLIKHVGLVQSRNHHLIKNVTCSDHEIAYKNCLFGFKQQSLTHKVEIVIVSSKCNLFWPWYCL